jgi:hypothetical protein
MNVSNICYPEYLLFASVFIVFFVFTEMVLLYTL